jgi:pseudaminic acid synthase
MQIKNIKISCSKPFIVAEISGNHNGSLSLLKKTILAAKRSGVDAVKLQSYQPEDLTLNIKRKIFKVKGVKNKWKNKYLYDIYNEGQTPLRWHKNIFDFCKKKKILCFSSPFSEKTVSYLEKLNCPAYKVASLEITNFQLLKRLAKTKKPIIISTGASNIKEISTALSFFKNKKNIAILKCTVDYPCENKNANINSIKTLKKTFKNIEVGFSDHTQDPVAAIIAINNGASIIEKHFIINKKINSVDNFFSTDEENMKKFVYFCKEAPKVLGSFFLKPTKNEQMSLKYRRSVFVSSKIQKGDIFSKNNIKVVRPASGSPVKIFDKIIGKKAKKDYRVGDKI